MSFCKHDCGSGFHSVVEREEHEKVCASNSNGLLATASRHYCEMAPHVRKRKTAELFKELIKQNEQLQEALVYVAHASHRTPLHMLPTGVILSDSNAVEVSLNAGVTVVAKYGS